MQLRKIINTEQPSDKVIVVFVFLPLVRKEIDTFVAVHNAHRIREQGETDRRKPGKGRKHHKPGVPNELHFGVNSILNDRIDASRSTEGLRPNPELLERQLRLFDDYGKIYLTHRHRYSDR
jgi:hypothetical protein